ncbi:hypothetical protein M433DRAFT_7875 [Acidomyces richmondensis BFW]|nr:MAG: hypothetical protein FE78DRAFT_223242 [Acidomyces sp. 'richmondensis']KYG41540.1 hypothetical protein M433DRAFT_7875 [Acidomyces richmondensis BFW]
MGHHRQDQISPTVPHLSPRPRPAGDLVSVVAAAAVNLSSGVGGEDAESMSAKSSGGNDRHLRAGDEISLAMAATWTAEMTGGRMTAVTTIGGLTGPNAIGMSIAHGGRFFHPR